MRSAKLPRWAWPACILLLTAGCDGPGKNVKVLDPLPDPAIVEHRRHPKPLPPPPASPSAPGTRAAENWLPAKGLAKTWRYIVIHHTASPFGSLEDIDQWHRDNGWENGCGYHFVIGNGTHSADGQVEMGPRWRNQGTGAHCRLSPSWAEKSGVPPNHYNERGIGIALVGNLDEHPPTDRQMASLARLVAFLMAECHIRESQIIGHGDIDQTDCPGQYFSMRDLKRLIRALPQSGL